MGESIQSLPHFLPAQSGTTAQWGGTTAGASGTTAVAESRGLRGGTGGSESVWAALVAVVAAVLPLPLPLLLPHNPTREKASLNRGGSVAEPGRYCRLCPEAVLPLKDSSTAA